jgi:hypothetical protein
LRLPTVKKKRGIKQSISAIPRLSRERLFFRDGPFLKGASKKASIWSRDSFSSGMVVTLKKREPAAKESSMAQEKRRPAKKPGPLKENSPPNNDRPLSASGIIFGITAVDTFIERNSRINNSMMMRGLEPESSSQGLIPADREAINSRAISAAMAGMPASGEAEMRSSNNSLIPPGSLWIQLFPGL